MDRMDWDEEIDARGLRCPLPVLRARKRLLTMAPGKVLRLMATDPMAAIDLPHFCHEAGHVLIDSVVEGDATAYRIRAGIGRTS